MRAWRNCRSASMPTLVADQPLIVKNAINEFMTSLWQAIAIIMACQHLQSRIPSRRDGRLSIPLTVAIVFPIMEFVGIDLQRISLGALIIALALFVDDAMTTIDAMTSRWRLATTRKRPPHSRMTTWPFPMLTGSLVTDGRLRADRFCDERPPANTRFQSLLWSVSRSLYPGLLRSSSRRCLASRCSRPEPKAHMKPNRMRSSACSADSSSQPCGCDGSRLRSRWPVSSCRSSPYHWFRDNSSRRRTVQSLLVDLRLPQNASIYASDQICQRKLDSRAQGRS